MIDLLMRKPAIVLQDVVVLKALRDSDLLGYGQQLGELVVGDVVELCAVVFGDDELGRRQSLETQEIGSRTRRENAQNVLGKEDQCRGTQMSFPTRRSS